MSVHVSFVALQLAVARSDYDCECCRWGQPFLEESYLYHVHRLDHRHNFSPYFYLVYLTYPSAPGEPLLEAAGWRGLLRSPLTSFVPQMALALGTGLLFGRYKQDLVFTWTVQTFMFVVFNTVCTSQVSLLRCRSDDLVLLIASTQIVLPVVYAISPSPPATALDVWASCACVWGGVDRDAGTVAERGVQARVPRPERLFRTVGTGAALCRRQLLGACRNHGGVHPLTVCVGCCFDSTTKQSLNIQGYHTLCTTQWLFAGICCRDSALRHSTFN